MSENGTNELGANDGEVPGMTLSGSFLDHLDFVEEASLSLLVSVGELDETHAKILVPFISMKVLGSKLHEDEPSLPIFSTTLALEDTAYLLSDFSQELATALDELAILNSGPVKVEQRRLDLVKQFIGEAASALAHCKSLVEKLEVLG
ncbi:hypothetical protein MUU53_20245 [Rhizobium lemnae]|uniref:Uncharacterized protein n=1 Tax=Rhizobium lemnae TaxID=1214924 RepID=A0ABV8E5L0_9HYPH|nr:hypothetical protein [Rhizobium lemnae]MCJ8510220.1 hypothetical protein [Rhizobium lemnae]